MQCDAMQCDATQHNTARYGTVRYNTMLKALFILQWQSLYNRTQQTVSHNALIKRITVLVSKLCMQNY